MADTADKEFQEAVASGELPVTFGVANIQPAGPGQATADVTISGPQGAPTTMPLGFVDQGGWKLSKRSAMKLMRQL